MSQTALKEQIQSDMKSALKAQEKQRLGTIRLLMAEIKQKEIDGQTTLDDTQIINIIDKMIKKRHDVIVQYRKASRQDLIDKEQGEIDVLEAYLPEPLEAEEINQIIDEAIQTVGANSMKEMGKVMGIIKSKTQGRADMSKVSIQIKERLKP